VKILVQWSKSSAEDWEELDSSEWGSTPRRGVPVGGETVDRKRGWIHALCIQGVVFEGWDHYAVLPRDPSYVDVYVWNDDVQDWSEDSFRGEVWGFRELCPDPHLGGAINTRQVRTCYAASPVEGEVPFDHFPKISRRATRHGIWLPDELAEESQGVRSLHGWREWTEGVDSKYVDANGRVKDQRAMGLYSVPDGTKTYYHSSIQRSTSVHNSVPTAEMNALNRSIDTPTEESSDVSGGSEDEAFVATTEGGEPGFAQWPTGTYRYQLDVTSVHASIVYGLRPLGTALGHFSRVDSALSTDLETHQQQEAAFFGAGLRLATTGNVSWSPGSVDDRFEILIAMQSLGGHGKQLMTLQLGELDDFADGPWSSSVVIQNPAFFGANF